MRFKPGYTPWNKGKTGVYSEETLQNMSKARKGQKLSEETKQKISNALTGRTRSKEHNENMSKSLTGKKHSKEAKLKISKSMMGKQNAKGNQNFLGRHHTEETKLKISKTLRELFLKGEFKGNRGGTYHQDLVTKVANALRNEGKKVEIEKVIPIGETWKVIDVLVDDNMCYEIGRCFKDKIQQLETNGYEVIHLPYDSFEEVKV